MKLHRELGISQKSAWFVLHRLRKAAEAGDGVFSGPVEVDQTYFGGKRKNMKLHESVNRDMDAANRLQDQSVQEHPFRMKCDKTQFSVIGGPIGSEVNTSPPKKVMFMVNGDSIRIVSTQENLPAQIVTREWDTQESRCILCVHGRGSENREEYTEDQISKFALEPPLFA